LNQERRGFVKEDVNLNSGDHVITTSAGMTDGEHR
jgi:hypothetical protein